MSPTPTNPTDRLREAVRAIHALKSPPPDGSQHYRAGFDAGLESAADAVEDLATAVHHVVDGALHLCHSGDHYCPEGLGQAAPAVWSDGDPLMEAIAAAVYDQCETHPEQALTVDDPRNIAAVAATVARRVLGTPTTNTEARDCGSTQPHQPHQFMRMDAVSQCPGTVVDDRATVLNERADFLESCLRNAADPEGDPRYWSAISDVIRGLRQLAAEAQQPAPAETEEPTP